ncbi:MAG: HEAT repeat domain-containing protein [Candidatus Riflebacteria bacterium]|nr:HEAT repeat domain-containing protein [Candidatus Riflebacteria bacterium]
MNSILMIVIAVVILLLVFVMFSLDDQEEETGFLSDDKGAEPSSLPEGVAASAQVNEAAVEKSSAGPRPEQIKVPEKASVRQISRPGAGDSVVLLNVGGEEDLRLRIMLDQRLAIPTDAEDKNAVVAAVQIRFPEEVLADKDTFLKLIRRAEGVFEKQFSFDFSCFAASQLDRIWMFGRDEGRDDALFEALVVAFEVVSRFKQTLETDSILRDSHARVSVGLAMGKLVKIGRGMVAEPTWVGKPAYLAETLAEAALDFSIYVDEEIHKAALSLFDFREWKPVKLRSPLPPLPVYELVGWNKPDEIASFASHKDAPARRAVAVAYRYLELDSKMQPLLELIGDPDEKVALEALETIKIIGNEHALGILKRIFPETQDPVFRSAIIEAFASIGRDEVVPVILGSTKEVSWKVRLAAAKALHKLAGADSLKHLEPLISDPDGAVRACVNGAFYRATGKKEYLDVLAELSTDLSKRTRKAAIDELLDIESDATLKTVIASFCEQDTELQKHTLRRLEFSKSKILYQCFLSIFKNSGEKIRPFIAEAVRRAGLVN